VNWALFGNPNNFFLYHVRGLRITQIPAVPKLANRRPLSESLAVTSLVFGCEFGFWNFVGS
jgi:hypothetical protein